MPPRIAGEIHHNEELATILRQFVATWDERNKIMNERMDAQDRRLELIVSKTNGNGNGAKDKTSLPTWMMPIVFTVLFILLGFVYQTLREKIDSADSDMRAWKAYTINLMFKLQEKGISVPPTPDQVKENK